MDVAKYIISMVLGHQSQMANNIKLISLISLILVISDWFSYELTRDSSRCFGGPSVGPSVGWSEVSLKFSVCDPCPVLGSFMITKLVLLN